MSSEFEVEHVVRLHTEGGCIEVGTDPDTGTCVEIRYVEKGVTIGRITLWNQDAVGYADAVAEAIQLVASKLKGESRG